MTDENVKENCWESVLQTPSKREIQNTFTIPHDRHKFAIISVTPDTVTTYATLMNNITASEVVNNIISLYPETQKFPLFVVHTNRLLHQQDFDPTGDQTE